MTSRLTTKLAVIAATSLLLLIPITMIDNLIADRMNQRDAVLADIARSSSYHQVIAGPLLVVPYSSKRIENKVSNGVLHHLETVQKGLLYFLPDQFSMVIEFATDVRSRGIYDARLYHARATLEGRFYVPAEWGIAENNTGYDFGTPFISIGIHDVRGIENSPELVFDGSTTSFLPGTAVPFLNDGIHAPVSLDISKPGQQLHFSLALNLLGTERFEILPVGRETSVSMSSDWPHPSFIGDVLSLVVVFV
jgi:inner membrane protein